MWPEVEEAANKKRHEIRLTGKKLEQRLEEAPDGLEELAVACPFLTFVDLSECPSLEALPANFSQLQQLHEFKSIRNGLRCVAARPSRAVVLCCSRSLATLIAA